MVCIFLTSILAENAGLFSIPVPQQNSAVVASTHNVAILVDVALGPCQTRHHVEVPEHDLYDFR